MVERPIRNWSGLLAPVGLEKSQRRNNLPAAPMKLTKSFTHKGGLPEKSAQQHYDAQNVYLHQ